MMMSTLHTTDAEIEALLAGVQLDMNQVASTALARKRRRWHIEFDLVEGQPFVWDGEATDERDAICQARAALRREGLDDTARISICLERRA